MRDDPYATLGVKSTATQAEIQAAYKKKARELHPDVNKAPDADERFRKLVDAYELLKDEDKRARFDAFGRRGAGRASRASGSRGARPGAGRRSRTGGAHPFADIGFEDIKVGSDDLRTPFEDILRRTRGRSGAPSNGAGSPGPRRPEREVTLKVPLEHAYSGTTLTMTVDLPGRFGKPESHALRLKIPVGAKDGDRLKIKDPEMTVVLDIEPPDGVEVDGRDVRTSIELTPWEAALGGEIDVPSPKGPLRLKVPPGTSTGQKLRLRGQGIPPKPGRDGEAGDMYVKVRIVVPSALTDEERELWERLRAVSSFQPRKT